MNQVCAKCKGKGHHHPIRGIGEVECRSCKGTGIRVPKSSLGTKTVSVPVNGAWCKVCGDAPAVSSHHVVAQQRIRRVLPPDLARKAQADPRGTVPVCHRCHSKLEAAELELHPHELHPGFPDFIEQYDLFAVLPRYLGEAA